MGINTISKHRVSMNARHLSVHKNDGSRVEIEWPSTLELTHGPQGVTARYDLGQGSMVAGPGVYRSHQDGTVSLRYAGNEYIWAIA